MKKVALIALQDVIWVIGFVAVLGLSSFPILSLGNLIGSYSSKAVLFISIPLLAWLWLNLYVLVAGLLNRIIVRPIKEGRIRLYSKEWVNWRLSWIFYSYVYMFLGRFVLFNRYLKTLYFKLVRINNHFTSGLAITVSMQDANNLISLGRGSFIGSEVILATHLIVSDKLVYFQKVQVGEGAHIGARCSLAPGVKIGDHVNLGYSIMVSINTQIGDQTIIQGNTVIQSHVKIGKGCKIGSSVVIGDGVIIPDHTVIPSNTFVDKSYFKKAIQ